MILDTSALLAILQQEAPASRLARTLVTAPTCALSAATLVEASIVMQARFGADGVRDLDLLLARLHAAVEPVTEEQALVARRAYQQFGKGRHPAGLNYGDCFSYALAAVTGQLLLCTGADFPQTDIQVAAY
ncbi:MAG TPA: type II toxin-antitoxin system VapC family toxin [Thermomicrobiales bacterium]|nr:type II toxin-antitoxin system VapC family toxin [Thermomicrobiales bacterium]